MCLLIERNQGKATISNDFLGTSSSTQGFNWPVGFFAIKKTGRSRILNFDENKTKQQLEKSMVIITNLLNYIRYTSLPRGNRRIAERLVFTTYTFEDVCLSVCLSVCLFVFPHK